MLYWGCDGIPFFMEYTPPALCIRSITPSDTTGKVLVDMPSIWRDSDTINTLEIDETIVEFIMSEPFVVPMCPPGWPNPPTDVE
jgi:hypothetical protein